MTHFITNLVVSFASIFLDPGVGPQPMAGKLMPAAVRCPGTAGGFEELAQASMRCPGSYQYGADFDCGYGWVCYPDMYGYEDYSEEISEDAADESISPFQVVQEEPALDYVSDASPFHVVSVEPAMADEIDLADLNQTCDSLSAAGRGFLNAAESAVDRLLEMAANMVSTEPGTRSLAATAVAELKQMTVALLIAADAEPTPGMHITRRTCRNVPAGKLVPRLRITSATCRNVPAGKLVPRLRITSATCRNVPALAFKAVEPRVIGSHESPFVTIRQPASARVAASIPAIPAGEFQPMLRISRRIMSRAVVPAIPSGEYRSCLDVARTARAARAGTVARTQLRIAESSGKASPFVLVHEVTVQVAASSASTFSPFIEVISDRHIAGAEIQDGDAELRGEPVEVSDAADAAPAETDSAAVSSEAVYVASRIQSLSKAILSAVSETLGRAKADQNVDAAVGRD